MILVTGATGTIGRPLVNVLAAAGEQVRALARHTGIPADGLPAGVEMVRGDVSQPETIAAALHGVTTLFVHPRAVGADAAPTLLTREGLAKAFACSPGHIDALRKRGLPTVRLGDAPRFSLPAVLEWLEQETVRG